MPMSIAKRWKTTMRRLAYLLAEYDDAKSHYDESKRELETMVATAEAPKTQQSPPQDVPVAGGETQLVLRDEEATESRPEEQNKGDDPQPLPSEEESVKPPVAEHFKRLWWAIAKATHPDVAGDDPDLLAAYKEAADAWEGGRHEELLDVAADISLSLSDPDPALVAAGEKRCDFYSKMLEELKSSSVWQWGQATPKAKDNILRLLVGQRAKRKTETN